MKEIQQRIKPLEEKVVAAEQRHKSTHFVGKYKLHKGQKMFKFHKKTGVLSEVDDSDYKVVLRKGKFTDTKVQKQLHIRGDKYQYVIALNKKNAARKLRKKGYKVELPSKVRTKSVHTGDKERE